MIKPSTLALLVLSFTALNAQSPDPNSLKAIAESDSKPVNDNKSFKQDMAVLFAKKTDERIASEQAFAQWSLGLNQFLMVSDDSFSQAMTLSRLVSGLDQAGLMAKIHDKEAQAKELNDLSYQPYADAMNMIIAQNNLPSATLNVLSALCFNDKLKDYCHANVLLEKRMQSDTTNLQVYLRPFELAYKSKNAKAMQQLLQLMSVSEHSKTVFGITEKMQALIDEYIALNPIPQSAIDNMVADYKKLSGTSPEIKAKLAELMPDYMPFHITASYTYLNDLPPYKPVIDFCKQVKDAAETCRDIADIMINNSNSMIDKAIGHTVLIASFEAENDKTAAMAANQLNENFKQSYQCIKAISHQKYFIDNYFDAQYQKINASKTDEFEHLIQLAELHYKKSLELDKVTVKNPESCFTQAE